jgi:uncharacterized membrane protein
MVNGDDDSRALGQRSPRLYRFRAGRPTSAQRARRSDIVNRVPGHAEVCQVCHNHFAPSRLTPAALVRPILVERIRRQVPDWSDQGFICRHDLNRLRANYIQELLEQERGELSSLERSVIESIERHETLASNVEEEFAKRLTLGERLADRIADFGGSWWFIAIFTAILLGWMAVNSAALTAQPFDPYPYILLNLVLSALAAIQAPIIMMSQNRQEARDRIRSENDYRVNLKAELEIRHLHEKLDFLLAHQWQRLLEIQQIQIDLMNELDERR